MIEIIKAQNGFICEWWEDTVKEQMVFEDDESGDLRAMQKTLYYVLEHFGLLGSKHDKERIRIIIEGRED